MVKQEIEKTFEEKCKDNGFIFNYTCDGYFGELCE
jgi:hypothetical protein